jgi:hypothetical protein
VAKNFYRLFGDTNGSRKVTTTDRNNVNANIGRTGVNEADVNGDGIVNSKDRDYVTKQLNRALSTSLPLDD